MNKTLQLTALVIFFSIHVMAQQLPCFNFEDIPAGTQLGPVSGNSPGDVLFSQAGIQVSLQEILYPDGTTGFGNAMVYDSSLQWLDGQFFFMGNNSLEFNLAQADGALNQLCFDFFDGGGVENFAVNGSAPVVVDDFSEIANLSFPGVDIEVDLSTNSMLAQGAVCITGDIESLLIGGQEFGIDNVCADAVLNCPISNLSAEIVGCDGAGNYDVEVGFDWLSPLTVITNFDIFVEGEPAATITQADLPYLLTGVQPATDALDFTLTVCQADNPDCCASVILRKECPGGSCVEFEGLSEAAYGNSSGTLPGEPFYDESNISMQLIPFQGLFWSTTYGDLTVLNEASAPEMTAASGHYLQFVSVNAVFDLTAYPEPVDSVVVDFYYNGGAINLGANGSNILIQNSLAPGLYALAPGITVRVTYDGANMAEGQLTFTGNVQSLLIGGEGDFRIDNLCINPVDEPCELSNMTVDVGPCNNDGTFSATIDFDYQGASDSFILSGPGALSTFAYADLPVTIADAPINNSGIYAYYATDTGAGLCWVGDTIQAEPCTGCAFEGLSIDYQGLSANGQNIIQLDFELTGPTLTDFFSVYFDGELYAQSSWNTAPQTLLIPCSFTGDVVQEVTVCEGDDDCCITLPLIYLEPCFNPCTPAVDSVSHYLTDCNGDGNYFIVLEQVYPNPPNLAFQFYVAVDGQSTGIYTLADLPIELGQYSGNGFPHEVAVYTQNTPACPYAFVTEPVSCPGACPLESVSLVDIECNYSDFYRARLRVEGAAAGDVLTITSTVSNFSVTAAYTGDGIVVEMPDNGQNYDELTVCLPNANTTNTSCCVEIAFDYPCVPCDVFDVHLDPLACNIDTSFSFVLDFEAQGVFSDTFTLQLSNGLEQIFLYTDLPVTLGPIPGLGEQLNYWLTNESGNCGRSGTFLTPDCIDGCVLGQATTPIAAAGCNDDGTYNMPISIENAQLGDLLLVQSAVTGYSDTLTYGVINAPLLQISGWPAPPNGQETLNICFFDQPDCCTTITFPVPCDTDCDFTATVTLLPCEVNGLLRFSLTTSSNDPNLPWVMANINGQYFGRFAMNTTVEFGQIINDGSFNVVDVVVEAWPGIFTGPACSVTVPVDVSGCVADCEIPGLTAEPLGCTGFGGYEVQLSFATDSLAGQNVDIYGNGDLLISNAAPADQVVGLFPYNPGQSQDVITVCYTNGPDCCESIAIEPALCECNNITDITATPLPCEGDGYFVEVDLEYEDNGFPVFFLNVDGQFYGEYPFSGLPITVGPFPGDGEGHSFYAYGNGQCEEAEAWITGQNCIGNGCQFTSVIAEPQGCDGSQFMVDVEVRAVNPGASGYFIFADGQINGPVPYSEPFVTLGPFEGDGSTVYDFLILDAEDPTCFGYAEVGPIDCGMTCDITNLLVQPLGCNDDGTYNVFLNFDVDFPGNDFFEVYGRNGNLIDFYRLDERPIVIEGLRPSASGEGYLRVCVNDNPNCCEEIEFPEPDCPGACRISDVQAEFDYCDADGNYYVRLSFNVDNPEADGFRVFGNGQDYGVYSYTMPFPVIVGPITPTGALAYELIVADLNNPDCRGFTEFEAFDCNDDPQVCITFDEFETLVNDTVGLAVGSPVDSIYDEDGLIFNAVAIPLGSNIGFFDWVYGFAGPACSNMPSTDGNLGMNGGVEMDFSAFSSVPTTITFDLVYCFAPNTIPQIVIGANGELYSGPITDLPDELPGGIRLEFIPDVNTDATLAGQFTIGGPVEHLVIGGRWLYIDNLCFNQPGPVVDNCVSFDVYDGLPMDTLADFGQPQDMEYEEDGVLVTASGIDLNGFGNYFGGVYDYPIGGCGFGDDDAALSFGGALRFSFAALPNLPTETSFDVAFCATVNSQFILLDVNGQEYRGEIDGLPDMLGNVGITAQRSTDNASIWTIELTGTVEAFTIGGPELSIDDVCFNTPMEETEVWPGDANADNLAHHIDLLNIGLAYGFQGQPRFEDGDAWAGVTATDWPQAFADGANYKHADCNGDGVVDGADRQVLVQNYGRSHGPWAMPPDLPGTDTDPPIYADFPAVIPVGTPFTIPLVLGSRGQVVQDIYGIAFTIEFDPQIFNGSAFELSYPVSWFGEPGINTISIDRTYANEGRIEVALTRTDQNNVSGHGLVAYLIGIIDDIAGYQPTAQMTVKDVVAISVNEERIPLQGRTVTFELDDKVDVPRPDAKGVFSVFPNPTSDWITVTSKYGYQPEQLTLLTLDGREVRAPQEGNQRVSLEGLPAGTYILSIRTGDTRVHKMVVKE